MKVTHVALAAALLAVSAAASAQTTTYTSAATFLANVAPGSYTEGFADPFFSGEPSATFTGNGFTYTVSAPGGVYGNGTLIGTNLPTETLTVTFSGATVTAIGGNFWATNISDVFQPVPVTLTLSDGTTTTFTPVSETTGSFRGFTTTLGITSMTIASTAGVYAGMGNLTVGVAAIPEPGTWLMMALGVGALLLRNSRRNAQA
ncbi:PEP-CTERM sorting domain-containing protein [Rubrivivax rivuli]|uniref:PEP-CTERM sorting domain-containing protein n=1 Tax=Rubrivivax rivuli TaxID=1862385 RepID=A0A437RC63_9BURK|nr:PEP-CTERM sorting domain-containing protein [Rubrivivax rivuli]RVU44264.1 PEP-CTERM sorting domain-containing protein [Rubrivivax rivuli]